MKPVARARAFARIAAPATTDVVTRGPLRRGLEADPGIPRSGPVFAFAWTSPPIPGRRKEVPMAAIVRRWVRALCEECGETVPFEVRPDWSLVCPECRAEKALDPSGLYAVVPIRAA